MNEAVTLGVCTAVAVLVVLWGVLRSVEKSIIRHVLLGFSLFSLAAAAISLAEPTLPFGLIVFAASVPPVMAMIALYFGLVPLIVALATRGLHDSIVWVIFACAPATASVPLCSDVVRTRQLLAAFGYVMPTYDFSWLEITTRFLGFSAAYFALLTGVLWIRLRFVRRTETPNA